MSLRLDVNIRCRRDCNDARESLRGTACQHKVLLKIVHSAVAFRYTAAGRIASRTIELASCPLAAGTLAAAEPHARSPPERPRQAAGASGASGHPRGAGIQIDIINVRRSHETWLVGGARRSSRGLRLVHCAPGRPTWRQRSILTLELDHRGSLIQRHAGHCPRVRRKGQRGIDHGKEEPAWRFGE